MEIAFAAFGVLLAGFCPVVVAQLRHVKKLEARLPAGSTYYLVPRAEPWARKVAGTATLTTTPAEGGTANGSGPPASPGTNTVTITSLAGAPSDDSATAVVVQSP